MRKETLDGIKIDNYKYPSGLQCPHCGSERIDLDSDWYSTSTYICGSIIKFCQYTGRTEKFCSDKEG